MATYYDGLNDFHKFNENEHLASSAQLLYLHLLHINNRLGNSGHVQVSDRELATRTSLNVKSVTKAKRILKNCGLINFFTDPEKPHRGTYYDLKFFCTVGQTMGQTMGQTVGQTVGQTPDVANIRVRDKTEDIKTTDLQSINPPRACAPVNWDCENELVTLWLDNGGARVTAELLSYLQALVEKHGVEWTAQAIRDAAGAFSGDFAMSLNFLRGCVKRKLEGGDKRVRATGQSRVNRPNVLNFTANTSGKGRFDDDPELDYSWIPSSGKGRFDDEPDCN